MSAERTTRGPIFRLGAWARNSRPLPSAANSTRGVMRSTPTSTGMPKQIGPYRIEREIARGGMGIVYLARDTRLDRWVAIKALPDDVAADPDRLARFEREAKTLASLNHPNVAGIYGVEESGGRRYLALEHIEGETLAARLARGPLSLQETLEI